MSPIDASVWDYVGEIREVVYRAIEEMSPTNTSFVFTNVLVESDQRSRGVVERLQRLAAARSTDYVAIMLTCDERQLRERVADPDRLRRRKWVDPGAVVEFARMETLVRPDGVIDIDVTTQSPDQSAVQILRQLGVGAATKMATDTRNSRSAVIRVVEQFIEAKSEDRVCEDMIVVTDDFAAVIDGASDATGARFGDKSGGRLAAEVIAAAISGLSADIDARTFADTLSGALAAAVGDLPPDVRWPVAVVSCASARRREVWRIGDCNVVIDQIEHPSTFRLEKAASRFRAAVNAALMARGMPIEEILEHDPGAQARRILTDNQQHLANTVGPWGYGCINGKRVPSQYIEVMAIPEGPAEVVLTSDGYPVVGGTLRETEATLARLVRDDPAAIGELWKIGKPATRGSNAPDDRAYLRFTIGSGKQDQEAGGLGAQRLQLDERLWILSE